ncbi:hypothetical protein BDQ17DRAFT_1433516 [Cyathus striatus]|nr:hypothetical protein BDQ17DRAFT_1433516 [Cyathus striatus]
MAAELYYGSNVHLSIMKGGVFVAMLIADSLLVWRCYVIWLKKKWLLMVFGFLLIGEVGLIPTLLVLSPSVKAPTVTLFFMLMGITLITTSMIIYRIVTVSKHAPGAAGRYRYIIEILVESGTLYSGVLLITGIVESLPSNIVSSFASYFVALLIPIIGIAPTLMTERVMISTEKDDEKWSQPISGIRFRHTTRRDETHEEHSIP